MVVGVWVWPQASRSPMAAAAAPAAAALTHRATALPHAMPRHCCTSFRFAAQETFVTNLNGYRLQTMDITGLSKMNIKDFEHQRVRKLRNWHRHDRHCASDVSALR